MNREIFILALSATFIGCASTAKPLGQNVSQQPQFDVTVSTEGKVIKNFDTQLVHRISLRPNTIKTFLVSPDAYNTAQSSIEKDREGKVIGVRILSKGDSLLLQTLGLEQNDLITAVGVKHSVKLNDLGEIFRSLVKDKEASLTLERDGRPHKFLYYVDSR